MKSTIFTVTKINSIIGCDSFPRSYEATVEYESSGKTGSLKMTWESKQGVPPLSINKGDRIVVEPGPKPYLFLPGITIETYD